MNMATYETPNEMVQLSETVAELLHAWGFKRVHGRIWSHLLLADSLLDAAELVKRLKISKALVSISIREMLNYGFVEEASLSSHGTQLYRANKDLHAIAQTVIQKREKELLNRVKDAQEKVSSLESEQLAKAKLSPQQVDRFSGLIQTTQRALENLISMRPPSPPEPQGEQERGYTRSSYALSPSGD